MELFEMIQVNPLEGINSNYRRVTPYTIPFSIMRSSIHIKFLYYHSALAYFQIVTIIRIRLNRLTRFDHIVISIPVNDVFKSTVYPSKIIDILLYSDNLNKYKEFTSLS